MAPGSVEESELTRGSVGFPTGEEKKLKVLLKVGVPVTVKKQELSREIPGSMVTSMGGTMDMDTTLESKPPAGRAPSLILNEALQVCSPMLPRTLKWVASMV